MAEEEAYKIENYKKRKFYYEVRVQIEDSLVQHANLYLSRWEMGVKTFYHV